MISLAPRLEVSALPRFFESLQLLNPRPGRSLDIEWLPDGRTGLLFRGREDGRGWNVWAGGPRTRAIFKTTSDAAPSVLLRFKPGWSTPLLGVSTNVLTDQTIPLQDIWGRSGAERLGDLLATDGSARVVVRVARALASRAREAFEPASGQIARRAVRLLEGGEVRVERVAERLGVTPRHLRRAFAESVGVGPKDFARAVRLQRALGKAASATDWGCIAVDAGYYDQAHLIADFHELVGLTPGAYLRRANRGPAARLLPAQL